MTNFFLLIYPLEKSTSTFHTLKQHMNVNLFTFIMYHLLCSLATSLFSVCLCQLSNFFCKFYLFFFLFFCTTVMNTIHKSTTEQTTEIYSLEPNKQNLSHKSFLPTYVYAKKCICGSVLPFYAHQMI